MTARSKAAPVPHSWPINDWPQTVYPNKSSSGRYVVRAYRDELQACGALTRVGRELVVLGEGYARFLARQSSKVSDYPIAPNQAGEAA
jgi:hypothetical protein